MLYQNKTTTNIQRNTELQFNKKEKSWRCKQTSYVEVCYNDAVSKIAKYQQKSRHTDQWNSNNNTHINLHVNAFMRNNSIYSEIITFNLCLKYEKSKYFIDKRLAALFGLFLLSLYLNLELMTFLKTLQFLH